MQLFPGAGDCPGFPEFRRNPLGNHETDKPFFKRFAPQDRIKGPLLWEEGNARCLPHGQMDFVTLSPSPDIGETGVEWTDAPASHHSAVELMHKQDVLREMQDAAA